MIDEKRVAHIRAELKEIMAMDYGKMRSKLRSMASPILAHHVADNDVDIADIQRRSTNAIKMPSYKPTVSGVIMSCSIPALYDIIFSEFGASNVLDAILDPFTYGYSNSSKSGYDFGRHKEVSDELHKQRVEWIGTAPDEKTSTWRDRDAQDLDEFDANTLGANALLDIISKVCLMTECEVDTDDITTALVQVLKNFAKTWEVPMFDIKAQGLHDLMENEPLIATEYNLKHPNWKETEDKLNDRDVPFDGICSHVVYNLAQMHSSIGLHPKLGLGTKSKASLASKVKSASKDSLNLVNMTLKTIGLDDIEKLSNDYDDMMSKVDVQAEELADMEKKLRIMSASTAIAPSKVEASGEIPSGKQVTKKAHEVFTIPSASKKMFDFDILTWEWEKPHPYVPAIDSGYIFRPSSLLRVLYALNTNQRVYLHGHTGSGKTTFIEQVCAYTSTPFMRVNFDSEVTRMDLLGRDVLTTGSSGATESKFVEGILPKMMTTPCVGCFDEIDFIRPDVAYVMQRAFEGNGLMLTEDGGRVVQPHPQFRMVATGNTVGQGDEYGMYQGARPQSMAMIDRFTIWVNVPYLDKKQRDDLLKSKVPLLKDNQREQLNQYVGEHLEAFTTSKVLQPISPRGMLSLGDTIVNFCTLFNNKDAVNEALEAVILDRCTQQDRAVLKGIVNRIFS